MVLRLYHHESGQAVPVGQARRGELLTYTVGPPGGECPRPRDLRCYLLSDLIRRVAERHRLQVTAWHNAPGCRLGTAQGARGAGESLRMACDALNIYPAEYCAPPPGPIDVGIGHAPGGTQAGGPAGRWVRPADVLADGDDPAAHGAAGAHPAAVTVAHLIARGIDPLALRLAFLRGHYRQPVSLTWDTLAAADESLRSWRGQVADWARSPSKPMNTAHVAQIAAALDDDLGTPAALGTLQALADDDAVAPGAKFETFAYLDRLLGLDLARWVGR
jgi:hypothetical protein